MKNLNITYEDRNFKELARRKKEWEKTKGKITWEDFVFMAIIQL